MKKLSLAAVTCVLGLCTPAFAESNMDLLKQKQCLSCHAVDKDTLAPSFKSIATKYKNQSSAEATLVAAVIGNPERAPHWGTMKMVSPGARPVVNQDEAKQLVQWVLSQK